MNIREFAYKLMGNKYTKAAFVYRQSMTYLYSVFHPYHYRDNHYVGTFLENDNSPSIRNLRQKVNRVIYIFWTGNNEIPPNRLMGINSLEKISGVEVKLVTPQSLPDYIINDDPLPEAYQYLSYVHRADYLRTYFMYHHGGGYSDIKQATASWLNAFDRLDNSDAYAIGYPEVGFWGVANRDIDNAHLKKDLYYHWRYLIGNCAYICRPYTPFVTDWYRETKRRVESYTEVLRQHPAQDPFGRLGDYPIPWENILGEVFHPLCLKYHDKLLKDKSLLPSFENYR